MHLPSYELFCLETGEQLKSIVEAAEAHANAAFAACMEQSADTAMSADDSPEAADFARAYHASAIAYSQFYGNAVLRLYHDWLSGKLADLK